MRVWADLTNSPHVLVLRPVIRALERAGADVLVTARDFAQTLELAARHGLEFTIPAREIARGSAALVRGLELERTLDPDFGDAGHFEAIWTAFVTGLSRPREEQA
jgi:predicted glycosyltransferase